MTSNKLFYLILDILKRNTKINQLWKSTAKNTAYLLLNSPKTRNYHHAAKYLIFSNLECQMVLRPEQSHIFFALEKNTRNQNFSKSAKMINNLIT